jgi:hypothetical protein
MTLSQLINAAAELSTEQQLALNKALCELIRSNRKVNAAIASGAFSIGDVVRFDAKRKGLKMIKITGWNRARTCAVGFECNNLGERNPLSTRWTVATTLLSKVA